MIFNMTSMTFMSHHQLDVNSSWLEKIINMIFKYLAKIMTIHNGNMLMFGIKLSWQFIMEVIMIYMIGKF